MINIAICDDEKIFVDEIEKIVRDELEKTNIPFKINMFLSGEYLLEELIKDELKYDVVFLDILMDGMDGIHIGKKIKKLNESIYIIYVSGSQEFLIDGYDVGAFNYILKPINEDRVRLQIHKIIDKITFNKKNVLELTKLGEIIKVNIENIKYCEIENRIITIFYRNETIEYYGTIKELEKSLEIYNFIRCHRSFLVNPKYIFKIEGLDLVLENNKKLPISRLRLKNVKEQFRKYLDSI